MVRILRQVDDVLWTLEFRSEGLELEADRSEPVFESSIGLLCPHGEDPTRCESSSGPLKGCATVVRVIGIIVGVEGSLVEIEDDRVEAFGAFGDGANPLTHIAKCQFHPWVVQCVIGENRQWATAPIGDHGVQLDHLHTSVER